MFTDPHNKRIQSDQQTATHFAADAGRYDFEFQIGKIIGRV